MNILADENIRIAEATFGAHATIEFMEGRAIRRTHLRHVDALIVRTATRVDAALLSGTAVRFVGSTTIGTDHLDTKWLDTQGISWANAPGCNADAAAQYTLAMIWLAINRLQRPLTGLRAGIIGRGHVGSRVQRLLNVLGVHAVCNDPPLAEQGVMDLVPLEAALASDIVCLHVPLTQRGAYPTRQLIGNRALAAMPRDALLVNTARGDVIAREALLRELETGRIHAALDVWPGEPLIDADLLRRATVATPHVAGYSEEGKRAGTLQVYAAFCRWAGLEPVLAPPPRESPLLEIGQDQDAVTKALDAACFVGRHDEAMRSLESLSLTKRAAGFDRLRKNYPLRRDFQAWRISVDDPAAAQMLNSLGFMACNQGIPRAR